MSAATVVKAFMLLAPVAEKLGEFLDDKTDEIPDVPGVLKSDIELARLEERHRKAKLKA